MAKNIEHNVIETFNPLRIFLIKTLLKGKNPR
jgi:hypothetical protein